MRFLDDSVSLIMLLDEKPLARLLDEPRGRLLAGFKFLPL